MAVGYCVKCGIWVLQAQLVIIYCLLLNVLWRYEKDCKEMQKEFSHVYTSYPKKEIRERLKNYLQYLSNNNNNNNVF